MAQLDGALESETDQTPDRLLATAFISTVN